MSRRRIAVLIAASAVVFGSLPFAGAGENGPAPQRNRADVGAPQAPMTPPLPPGAHAVASTPVAPSTPPAVTPSPAPSSAVPVPASLAPSIGPLESSLAVSLATDPTRIELGETTSLHAEVTNTGSAAVEPVTLAIDVPREVVLLDAAPPPELHHPHAGGVTYDFSLGELAPGATATVDVIVEGAELSPRVDLVAVASSGDLSATATQSIAVVDAQEREPGLQVTSRSKKLLAQMGSNVRYIVRVSNTGQAQLDDVLVLNRVAPEIHVVSADIVDDVEAVQIGSFKGREDIVWNVGTLAPGESVDLPWDGQPVRAGDLEAANLVEATARHARQASARDRTYLATASVEPPANPPFEPIVKRKVTLIQPAPKSENEDTEQEAEARAGERARRTRPLPVTGSSSALLLTVAGLLLSLAGVLMLWVAQARRTRSQRLAVAALAMALATSACFSASEREAAVDDEASGRRAQTSARPQETPEPRVKGLRIHRGANQGSGDRGTRTTRVPGAETPAPVTETPAPPPPVGQALPTSAPVATPMRTVEVVEISLEDLPVVPLESREGDNVVYYEWDEPAAAITLATSGLRLTPGAQASLTTTVTSQEGRIVAEVVLRNTSEDERLAVEGRLIHEITAEGETIARLNSRPIQTVLSPGGEVGASFSYRLPLGAYEALGGFEAD